MRQYEVVMGERITPEPALAIETDGEFSALVEPDEDGYRIHVTTGTIEALELLWSESLKDAELLSPAGSSHEAVEYDAANLADVSLIWLFLHELMHFRLGHFEWVPGSCLAESQAARKFSLVSRAQEVSANLEFLSPDEQPSLSPCLELQADYDTIDVMLDVYGDDRWEELRIRSACIFAVMALIEREDQRWENRSGTHPLSSTRFFMMLGHLFQMWAHRGAELEEDKTVGSRLRSGDKLLADQFQDYADAMLAPALNDAIILANTAKARSLLEDVGGDGGLLQDLWTIQYAEGLSTYMLKSDGAKQWLHLMPINEKIMIAAGHR